MLLLPLLLLLLLLRAVTAGGSRGRGHACRQGGTASPRDLLVTVSVGGRHARMITATRGRLVASCFLRAGSHAGGGHPRRGAARGTVISSAAEQWARAIGPNRPKVIAPPGLARD